MHKTRESMDKQQKETSQIETTLYRKVSVDYPPKKRGRYLTDMGYANYKFHCHHVETWEQFHGEMINEIKPEFWLKQVTEPVSEEEMMNEANKFLNSDTPDIKKAVESNYWAVYRMAQFALWIQQRQVNPPNKK